MTEEERLLFTVERYDHFYDSVNNKSSVYLAISTFVVGGLFAVYPTMIANVNCTIWVHLLMCSMICLGLAVIIIVLLASMPFLGERNGSLIYFGSAARLPQQLYIQKSMRRTSRDELKDLRIQAHSLSIGLNNKFRKLRIAGILFLIQFFLW